MLKGDVILGIDSRPFDSDARIAFGHALTPAETEAGKGLLKLITRPGDGRAQSYSIATRAI
jgi:hypothetical protein